MIISFEGLDGCGKSTQIIKLKKYLESLGKKVKVLREPGGNSISEKIRDILLDKKNLNMVFETELLLYLSSRAQLIKEEIIPLLESNHIVLLDRFIDSTTAYQGYGRGLDIEVIENLNNFVTLNGKYIPDLTFFISLDPKVSLNRVTTRGEEINRMETAKFEFFEKVHEGFQLIQQKNPNRMIKIDGSLEPNEVFESLKGKMEKRIKI
ncbi:MAG: dTMP kinase [Candidatus Delongbacteria bacterium]|jgi:dTMP kinase|nr:dTMP kinase [Candidatus Delongbacteria bacterium]